MPTRREGMEYRGSKDRNYLHLLICINAATPNRGHLIYKDFHLKD